jgi:hypothetical protein
MSIESNEKFDMFNFCIILFWQLLLLYFIKVLDLDKLEILITANLSGGWDAMRV